LVLNYAFALLGTISLKFSTEKKGWQYNPLKRVFTNCHAELVSASHETLKQVQGDKKKSIIKQSPFKQIDFAL